MACVVGIHRPMPVYSQAADLIRQKMLGQQSQQMSQPSINVPSIGEGKARVPTSELLPDEVQLLYPEQSEILLDGVIDPSNYIVGPGDLLVLYFWGDIDKSYLIRVTPEGYMIVPTVGSLKAADRTLKLVRADVVDAVSRKYKGLETSLFLREPKRFRLYVSGLVYVPGMHESHSGERVSDIIDRAGLILPGSETEDVTAETRKQEYTTPKEEVSKLSGEREEESVTSIAVPKRTGIVGRTNAHALRRTREPGPIDLLTPEDLFTLGEKRGSSSRTILVHRGDSTLMADMLRFIKLGDMDANPYVNSGDRIEVPPYHGDITIYGEVNDRGIYEFREGDTIADLIGFGGGLTSVADTVHARLNRFGPDGHSFTETTVNLHDALVNNPDDPRYLLEESDRLYVRKKFNYKELLDVTILGEVKYPGQYAIEKNETTLLDIIPMAGGFTGEENLDESRLIRKSGFATRDVEYDRLKEMEVAERNSEDNDFVRAYKRTFEGSINTDFLKLFRDNDLSYNVLLQDGDLIYIPLRREMVNVMGAVKEPRYVRVKEGADLTYYIEKAGGYNYNANIKFIRVIKARTSQPYRYSKTYIPIEGGDTIHVPERYVGFFWTRSTFWRYAGYLTQFATLYFIVVSLNK